jgi:hypothetical protein
LASMRRRLSPDERKVVPISGIGVVLLLTGRIRERNRDLIEEGDYNHLVGRSPANKITPLRGKEVIVVTLNFSLFFCEVIRSALILVKA